MIKNFTLVLLACLYFTSCTFSEVLSIKDNQEADFTYNVELTEMVNMLKSSGQAESLGESGFPIDTTMTFGDYINEKISEDAEFTEEELQKLEILDKLFLQIKFDTTESYVNIFLKEKNIESLNSQFKNMTEVLEIIKNHSDPEGEDEFTGFGSSTYGLFGSVELNKTANGIQRISVKTDENSIPEESKAMLQMTTYKLKYTFPKPVKSISLENATFSEDRKTVYYETSMSELMENPELLDFTVEY